MIVSREKHDLEKSISLLVRACLSTSVPTLFCAYWKQFKFIECIYITKLKYYVYFA